MCEPDLKGQEIPWGVWGKHDAICLLSLFPAGARALAWYPTPETWSNGVAGRRGRRRSRPAVFGLPVSRAPDGSDFGEARLSRVIQANRSLATGWQQWEARRQNVSACLINGCGRDSRANRSWERDPQEKASPLAPRSSFLSFIMTLCGDGDNRAPREATFGEFAWCFSTHPPN